MQSWNTRDGMLKHVDLLNFVRDDHKQEMKSKIMKCLTFDDSLTEPKCERKSVN